MNIYALCICAFAVSLLRNVCACADLLKTVSRERTIRYLRTMFMEQWLVELFLIFCTHISLYEGEKNICGNNICLAKICHRLLELETKRAAIVTVL